MARIRTIKPTFWDDEKVGKLSPLARLLFIGTWNIADDEGILIWQPQYLRARIFPYDDLTIRKVSMLMDEVLEQKFVQIYKVESETYAILLNFRKHQKISHPQPSSFPLPPEVILKLINGENSRNIHGTFTDDSGLSGREGNVVEGDKDKEGSGTREEPTTTATTANEKIIGDIFTSYESNIGALTPHICDRLKELIKEHPPDWIKEAIEKSTRLEKRNLGYVEGILKGWKQEGKNNARTQVNAGNPGRNNQKPQVETGRHDLSSWKHCQDDNV